MRRERTPVKALPSLTCRLSLAFFLLWLVSMVCITLISAQLFFDELEEETSVLEEPVYNWPGLSELYDEDAEDNYLPGEAEHHLLEGCANGSSIAFIPQVCYQWPVLLRSVSDQVQSAVVVTDASNAVCFASGNYYYFPYYSEEDWIREENWNASLSLEDINISGYAYTHFDPEAFTPAGKQAFEKEPHAHFWSMRFTGIMEGSQIIPWKIEYADYAEYNNDSFYVKLRRGQIPWITLYESEPPAGAEPVVLYTTSPEVSTYQPGKPMVYKGTSSPTLQALLAEIRATYSSENANYRHADLDERGLLRFTYSATRHISDSERGADGHLTFTPVYRISYALHASPLKMAAQSLLWVYLGTLLLAAALVLLLRKLILKQLLEPVQMVNDSIKQGWTNLWHHKNNCRWQEADQLMEHYFTTQDRLRDNKSDITRLNKALDYAQEAEENRRQMTSAIAHELKTPLAVIHSYAEGLQERINEDKREQYLNVILSECERMDGMVLEMLDLSRLEAGKVKLARDTFSLEELARGTFERLALAVEAKELKVTFDVWCDAMVTADEARMGQVITNFATNAVKYTPHGGKITVTIKKVGFQTGFYVENECPPLSRDALSKVWDTFYRTDSARSGGGTGLGLAIAKSIIELHGGQVGVRNTLTGVAFRFVI